MLILPKAIPQEFLRDVIAVARKGEAPIMQIAKDFGVSPAALHPWMKIADREDGVASRAVFNDAAKLWEAITAFGSGIRKQESCAALGQPPRSATRFSALGHTVLRVLPGPVAGGPDGPVRELPWLLASVKGGSPRGHPRMPGIRPARHGGPAVGYLVVPFAVVQTR